jgi:hypothetical protein
VHDLCERFYKIVLDTTVQRVYCGRMVKKDMQDIRIRGVPVELVRRLKSVLAAQGMTLKDWFMGAAALTADQPKRPAKDK